MSNFQDWMNDLDIDVPEFNIRVTDPLLDVMPASMWHSIEEAALWQSRGYPVIAEGYRRKAGYAGLGGRP